MLRRLGIRSKILAILAVPIAVLIVGALLISLTAVADSRQTRQVANLIHAAEDMRSVVESLQHERYASMRMLQASQDGEPPSELVNEVEQSRWLMDESLEALEEYTNVIDFEQLDDQIFELIDQTIEIHARLDVLRPRVDADTITEGAALAGFNDIIRNDIMLASRLAGFIEQPDAASYLSTYGTLDLLVEYHLQERQLGEKIIVAGERAEQDPQILQTLEALQETQLDDVDAALEALDTETRVPTIVSNLPSLRLIVQTGSEDSLREMSPDVWRESVDTVIENIQPARIDVLEGAAGRADAAADDARNQAIITIGAAALAVIISLVLALIVSRGIVVPLRRLTSAAEKVRDDLPQLVEQVATPGVAPDTELERIPVESRDEIGSLAAAFNSVNETTVEVAREQAALRGSIAEMFVNVARRDQVLLNRQLSFITQLERMEEDPEQLEDLFRLDHLATRMRRNAESLLVLAGIDSGRRLRNPMVVSDVVRTASSEIEHYDRIDLVLTADPAVLGHAALTVAHLLAELMENATVFSDPASRVEVMTAMRGDDVAISITDDGLGMDAETVAAANDRIHFSSASDVVGAQRLGMFVVGRLASRHGIQVQVASEGEGAGTRVDVLVPTALLDPDSLPTEHEMPPISAPVPVSGGISGLPQRQSAMAQPPADAQPPAAVASAASESAPEVPGEMSERTGLFTGFRSVSADPLESLESVDSATLEDSQRQAYVPLVSEDRDDLAGLSRADATARQTAADTPDDMPVAAREPHVASEAQAPKDAQGVPASEESDTPAAATSSYQPAISYDNVPLQSREPQLPQRSQPEAAQIPDEPVASPPDAEPIPESAAPSGYEPAFTDADKEAPQKQIRVYTGAFPTATGEYPTYTGEIPLQTAEMPRYPSRRSRREMRLDAAQTTQAGDHHVEFDPIAVEDASGPEIDAGEAEQSSPELERETPSEAGDAQTPPRSTPEHSVAPPQPEPRLGVQESPAITDPRPSTGGFPTTPTPGVGIVRPQPAGSFDASVMDSQPAKPEPKRKRFRLFGRKTSQEVDQTPSRESRFPTGMTFTPEEGAAPETADTFEPAAQPGTPATGERASLASWSPQTADLAPDEPQTFSPKLPEKPQSPPAPDSAEPSTHDSQLPQRQSIRPSAAQMPAEEASSQLTTHFTSDEPAPAQPAPAQLSSYSPQTSWAPTNENGHGALGAEAAEQLRRRSAMTSEVLSELSQLSTYKPESQDSSSGSSLTKRVPTEIPQQSEAEPAAAEPSRRRDASQVRSMLSGFQAGVNRAQSAEDGDSAPSGEER